MTLSRTVSEILEILGNWKWCHSTDHVGLTIALPL